MNGDLITINRDLCKKEGLCVRVCPKVFAQEVAGSVPEVVHEEFCNDCGHCMLICPFGAISHERLGPADIHPVDEKLLPSPEQTMEMLRARRSVRSFLERPVERGLIEKVIEGARLAPSAKNTQSTEFIVVDDKAILHQIASITAKWLGRSARKLRNPIVRSVYLMKRMTTSEELARSTGRFEFIARNMEKGIDGVLYDAHVLVLFHADRRIRFAEANANLALQNATFVASSLGLGSFYTGYVVSACTYDKEIPQLLGLPERHRVFAGLTLGYPKVKFNRWIDRKTAKISWI